MAKLDWTRIAALLLGMSALVMLAAGAGHRRGLPWRADSRMAQIELLDAGALPRHPLRYDLSRLESGPRDFELVFQEGLLVIRGILQGDESYTPLLVFRFEIQSLDRRYARLHERVVVRESRVVDDDKSDTDAQKQLEPIAESLVGLGVDVDVDAWGRFEVRADPAQDPKSARLWRGVVDGLSNQLFVPLPAQAVGAGARWRVSWPGRAGLIEQARYEATYTLDDAAADVIRGKVEIAVGGERQQARDNTAIALDQITGKLGGTFAQSLSSARPQLFDLEGKVDWEAQESDARGYHFALQSRRLVQGIELSSELAQ